MTFEAVADRFDPNEWRVEAINDAGDGEVYTAIFVGPEARQRAQEYAEWKTGARNSDA